jgi:uncharacterized protein (DUF1697 family)
MPRYVALLRSVNVAGHGRLSMSELRDSFCELGTTDVSTYIQSGNVVFTSPERNNARLVAAIEHQLERDFGHAPAVILRTVADLARVVAASPYPQKGAEPARHHVTFLAEPPGAERLAAFSAPASGNDELSIVGKEIYVHTPDGYGKTKLTGALLERRLGVVSTTRNWNTVLALHERAAGSAG